MRLDKFLWCIRIYKTRSIATEQCKKGHIKINGKSSKPSTEVLVSDNLSIRKNNIDYRICVIDIPTSRVGAKLLPSYIIDKTPQVDIENANLHLQSQKYYRQKGEGRPTKKDRREIFKYLFSSDDNMEGEEDELDQFDDIFFQSQE